LHVLLARAGDPSLRQVARGCGYSRETVGRLFKRPHLPKQRVLLAVVKYLAQQVRNGDVEVELDRFDALWLAAREDPNSIRVETTQRRTEAPAPEPAAPEPAAPEPAAPEPAAPERESVPERGSWRFESQRVTAILAVVDELDAAGDLDGAIGRLREIDDTPTATVATRLSSLLLRRGQLAEATHVLVESVKQGNHWHAPSAARLLCRSGGLPEAVALLRTAAEAGDDRSAVEFARLTALLAGRAAGIAAIEPFAAAGGPTVVEYLTTFRLQDGDVEGALDTLAQGSSRRAGAVDAPRAGWHLANRARIMARHGRTTEAFRLLEGSDDLPPFYWAPALADLIGVSGRPEAVVAFLERFATGGEFWAHERLVALYQVMGDIESALSVLADFGDDVRAARLVAYSGNLQEAVGRIYRLYAERSGSEFRLASVLERLAPGRGIDLASRSRTRKPGSATTAQAYAVGQLYAHAGLPDLAIAALRQPARSGDTRAALLAANLLAGWSTEQLTEVLEPYVAARHTKALVLAARWATSLEKWRELRAVLEDLAKNGFRLAAHWVAEVCVRAGDFDGAVEVLKPFVEAADIWSTLRLADVLARAARTAEAVDVLAPLVRARDKMATIQWARLLDDAGSGEMACDALRTIAAHDGEAAVVLSRILRVRDPAAAEAVLEQVAPLNVSATCELARLRWSRWGSKSAVATLQPMARGRVQLAVLELSNALAAGDDLVAAVGLLEPFVQAGDRVALQQLAKLLVRAGKDEAALEALGTGVRRGDQLAVVAAGRILLRRGQLDQAEAILAYWAERDVHAARVLAAVHLCRGDDECAIDVLAPHAVHSSLAAQELHQLYSRRGDERQAVAVLQPLAARGDTFARWRLQQISS
jgi:hypothetical protein